MSISIPEFPAGAPTQAITQALDEAGCVVVTNVMDENLRALIKSELAQPMNNARVIQADDPEEFYPGRTRRVSALVQRSKSIREQLLMNSLSQSVCEHHLLANSEHGYQLHVSAALEVGPGARQQVLHREEGSFTYFPLPRPNIIVASMWAVTDFSADNGATLLVPGSHKWGADREPEPEEITSAEMPAGSVLYWSGGLLHGAGANSTEDWRYGVILTYSLGWVRQEENQYLHMSQKQLAQLSPEVRRMIGFDMYGALGFYEPGLVD